MRYLAMQVLTWGTIASAIGSAVLLAALEPTSSHHVGVLSHSVSPLLWSEPPQSGRPRQPGLRAQRPPVEPAASTPAAPAR